MNDFCRLGLRAASLALHEARFTSEAYASALLARIAAHNEVVDAWAWLDVDRAREQARHADTIPHRADRSDCLRGIPLGVKDVIDTAGIPTECGTPALKGRVPQKSAAIVRKLEAAGGIMLGKTVTAEMAFYYPGPTHNPWNPRHTPGGSSSGSAAAVAAGFVPAALGTQTNGSVIRPAAFCGVVGLKPSSGLISRAGVQLFSKTLDHVGLFARSVEDAAMLGCCLSGFDEGDGAGLDSPQAICHPQRGIPPLDTPPRLALVRTPVWHLATPEQQENLLHTADRLRAAGATVNEVVLPPEFEGAHQLHRTIMFGEGARALQALQQEHRAQFSDQLNALIDEGLAISDDALTQALGDRLQVSRALHPILREYDALITPPATGEAPATLGHTGDPAFCTIWTLTGVPAISIPSGFGPYGLPLGVQIIGSYLKDDKLVAVAQWCEQQIGLGPLIAPLGAKH